MARTFDPTTAEAAYDFDYGSTTQTIFGEWERLPVDEEMYLPGSYSCKVVLTEESYTARLLGRGPDQVLKKIGEEATEVVLAGRGQSDERLAEESADLLYHLLVALHQRGVPLTRVMDELRRRRRGS